MTPDRREEQMNRRSFLLLTGGLTATSLVGGVPPHVFAQTAASSGPATAAATGRRRLGSLEVSSLGLGVQNMSRTYQTTIPSRPDGFHADGGHSTGS